MTYSHCGYNIPDYLLFHQVDFFSIKKNNSPVHYFIMTVW